MQILVQTRSAVSYRHWTYFLLVGTAIGLAWPIDCHGQIGLQHRDGVESELIRESSSGLLPEILLNMPTNSDKRCVGIAAVAEALLDGEQATRSITLERLAQEIYESLATGDRIQFPSHLLHEGQKTRTTDRKALDALGTRVADLYKNEHAKLSQTPTGLGRLLSAENKVIRTQAKLDRILETDRDHIDLFCCFGARQFPNGTYKATYHAVLIGKSKIGKLVIYDSNAPGVPIDSKFHEENGRMTIEWTCNYRDTGLVTTQRYQVVHKDRFFRIFRGLDRE